VCSAYSPNSLIDSFKSLVFVTRSSKVSINLSVSTSNDNKHDSASSASCYNTLETLAIAPCNSCKSGLGFSAAMRKSSNAYCASSEKVDNSFASIPSKTDKILFLTLGICFSSTKGSMLIFAYALESANMLLACLS
jgi:hypothetical protein